jgi:3-phosphoshikimate 1-carboxyvinyltransferase
MSLRISGSVTVPGDKSITHRALMLAACARGDSRLSGLLPGQDCRSTAAVLRALGCDVPDPPEGGGEIVVRGRGLEAWRAPSAPLDCGNSGTTARLMMGLLASRPFSATLTGDGSLRGRPMRRITEPLERMGARFRELESPGRLPIEVTGGALSSLDYTSPRASAQIKSAVLLAGLGAGVAVSVAEPVLSRDHTERMLASLGAPARFERAEGGVRAVLGAWDGPLPPLELRVPGDPSSAAFLAALALLAGAGELRIRGVCANPTRTGFFAIARKMMGLVAWERGRAEGGEPVSDLVVRPSQLRAVTAGGEDIPAAIDEIPVLAILAARAEGETRITGAGELRVKESDRIAAIVAALRAVGAQAEELDEGLVVVGSDHPLRGRVATHGDHRIAMAFGVLGALPGNEIEVDDPGCAAVSYPGFWEVLRGLAGGGGAEVGREAPGGTKAG